MRITVINWERHLIEEYETDSIKYEENEISFTMQVILKQSKKLNIINY